MSEFSVLVNKEELLNATSLATVTGSTVTLRDNSDGFIATATAASVGGTNPTFDLKIEHSHDDVDFYDLVSFTQITVDSTELKVIAANVMKFVRFDLIVGGTDTPTADLELNLVFNNTRRND